VRDVSVEDTASETGALIGLAYGNFMGYLGLTLAPMWVVAVASVEHGSAAAAGMIASLQFACFGIASLATAGLILRVEIRHLALVGLLLAVVGDGASCWADHISSIAVCRAICGLGEGILLATVNAAAASSNNPQRSFAVMSFVLVGLAALCFVATPFAKEALGSSGVFGVMAVMRLPGFLLLLLLPRRGGATDAQLRRVGLSRAALWVLAAYGLFMTGQLSVYAFLEPIGIAQGLSLRAIAFVLALGGFFTSLGPLAAGWLGAHFGLRRPLLFGLSATGLSALLFLLPSNVPAFASGDMLFNMIAQFCIVYFLGLLAALDRSGRAVAVSPAFMSVGITLGPLVGGLSIHYLGLTSVSLVAAALHVAAGAVIAAHPLGEVPT
jgi:predicted MFS family arabinose efflux permease